MSVKPIDNNTNLKRRKFLTTAAAGGSAALLVGQAQAADLIDEPQAKTDQGYRETGHIRQYYRSARV